MSGRGLVALVPVAPAAIALVLIPVLLAVGCGQPLATPEPVYLQAAGSVSMGPLVADLADAFREQNPTVSVEVRGLKPHGGLGTQFGLDLLRAGDIDLALASWLPSEGSGLDPAWRTTAIARDGLAIIVHPDNPLDGVGLLQLRDLFNGRSAEWNVVAGVTAPGVVQPVSREKGSGARVAFEALVMEGLPVTPRALVAPSGQAVTEVVAEDPRAIGYVSMSQVSPDVKTLKIEGDLPAQEGVGQGSYPLTRELWLIAREPVPEALQSFIDFALSPAGQQIVGRRFGRIR